jgi:signal transduction histidine kinase
VTAEDRERIARDLHDTVIQRLFATGLSLQGAAALIRADPEAAVQRVGAAVDDLDLTVKHIRTAIFGLETRRPASADTVLRGRVLELAREAAGALGVEPGVVFEGPLDSLTPEPQAADLLATLREALSNVARHAKATAVDVRLAIEDGDLVLEVSDDGIGPPTRPPPPRPRPRQHGIPGGGLRRLVHTARQRAPGHDRRVAGPTRRPAGGPGVRYRGARAAVTRCAGR